MKYVRVNYAMAAWRPEENIQRDLEKAQENIELYGGPVLKAPNRYELRTGIIVAARFADKLRRTAFAVFGGVVPRDEILKAVAELNRKVYERMVAMGIGKLDIIRVAVEAVVEDGRLVFGEPRIEWFVPHVKLGECEKKLAELRQKIEELLRALE